MSSPTPPRAPVSLTLSEDLLTGLVAKIDRLEQGLQALRSELALHRPSAKRSRRSRRGSDNNAGENDDDDLPTSEEAAPPRSATAGLARDMHTAHPITGETIFLGGNSVPAMAMALSQSNGSGTVQDLLDKSILPIFNLENESATYPFVDLWGLPHASTERIEKLCGLLPSDSECLQYLRQYRDTAYVLFPGIINMQAFEAEVGRFLVSRTAALSKDPEGRMAQLTDQNVYGRSVHWLGLLFACLASGCQCSAMPRRERQLTSQVYSEFSPLGVGRRSRSR